MEGNGEQQKDEQGTKLGGACFTSVADNSAQIAVFESVDVTRRDAAGRRGFLAGDTRPFRRSRRSSAGSKMSADDKFPPRRTVGRYCQMQSNPDM